MSRPLSLSSPSGDRTQFVADHRLGVEIVKAQSARTGRRANVGPCGQDVLHARQGYSEFRRHDARRPQLRLSRIVLHGDTLGRRADRYAKSPEFSQRFGSALVVSLPLRCFVHTHPRSRTIPRVQSFLARLFAAIAQRATARGFLA